MNIFRKTAMWFVMLNKRLYKKPSFVAILLLIVFSSMALTYFTKDNSSILRIALCAENADSDTTEFLNGLCEDDGLIKFEIYSTEDEALSAVTKNGYDAAWIFPQDIKAAMLSFAENGGAVVTEVCRSESVFLKLAKEKLYTSLYPYISREVYKIFMNDIYGETDEARLLQYYEEALVSGDIVDIRFANSESRAEEVNHITAPLKGILAAAMFLCIYSALMNFKQDVEKGVYAGIAMGKRKYIELVFLITTAANAALFTLISFWISGNFTSIGEEAGYMLLYMIMCSVFCAVIGEILRSLPLLSCAAPVITVLMAAVCPVFVNVRSAKPLQMLFPEYYYLKAFENSRFILWGIVYAFALAVLWALILRIGKRE